MKKDQVMISPTEGQVKEAVRQAVEAVNQGCIVRLVKELDVAEVFKTPAGRMETNGGGISYNAGATAATSKLGVAWWTDPEDNKHVRVVAERSMVWNRQVDSIFGGVTQSDFWCVYPERAELKKLRNKLCLIINCYCGRSGDLKTIGWDGNCCEICRLAAQYENETGFRPAGVKYERTKDRG